MAEGPEKHNIRANVRFPILQLKAQEGAKESGDVEGLLPHHLSNDCRKIIEMTHHRNTKITIGQNRQEPGQYVIMGNGGHWPENQGPCDEAVPAALSGVPEGIIAVF